MWGERAGKTWSGYGPNYFTMENMFDNYRHEADTATGWYTNYSNWTATTSGNVQSIAVVWDSSTTWDHVNHVYLMGTPNGQNPELVCTKKGASVTNRNK